MHTRLALLVGGAAGYVLGTKAGQARYQEIKTGAQKLWENPKLQESLTSASSSLEEKLPGVKKTFQGTATKLTGTNAETGSTSSPEISETPATTDPAPTGTSTEPSLTGAGGEPSK